MAAADKPLWLVKAMWQGTAIHIQVPAKDEDDAWEQAAKRVKKMEGGLHCLDLKVLRRIS